MNRIEFIEQLEKLLQDIPQTEREDALAYYNSYFEDAGVENEANILRELESPEKVAAIIKADIGRETEKEYRETGYTDTRFYQQEEVGNYTGGRQEEPDYRQMNGKEAHYQQMNDKKSHYQQAGTYTQDCQLPIT